MKLLTFPIVRVLYYKLESTSQNERLGVNKAPIDTGRSIGFLWLSYSYFTSSNDPYLEFHTDNYKSIK